MSLEKRSPIVLANRDVARMLARCTILALSCTTVPTISSAAEGSIGSTSPQTIGNERATVPGRKLRGAQYIAETGGAQATEFCADVGEVTSASTQLVSAPVGRRSPNTFFAQSITRDYTVIASLTISDPSVAVFAENGVGTLNLAIPADADRTPNFQIIGNSVGSATIDVTYSDGRPEQSVQIVTWQLKPIRAYQRDLHNTSTIDCYDPLNSPSMHSNVASRIGCGATPGAKGVATDGVSRLSFQVASGGEGRACLVIVDDGDDTNGSVVEYAGQVYPSDSPQSSAGNFVTNSTTVSGQHWAFGTYQVPDGLYSANQNQRTIRFGVGFNPTPKRIVRWF